MPNLNSLRYIPTYLFAISSACLDSSCRHAGSVHTLMIQTEYRLLNVKVLDQHCMFGMQMQLPGKALWLHNHMGQMPRACPQHSLCA